MNLDRYLSLIQAQAPELDLRTVEHDDKGWDNLVVLINREWIFRFPRTEEVAQRIQKEQRLLEYLHNRLNTHQVLIPRYRLLHDENDQAAGSYYKMIQGQLLKPSSLRHMSRPGRDRIAAQLGTFLHIIHTSDLEVLKDIGIEIVHTVDYWRNHLREIEQHVLPLLTPSEQNRVVNLFETYLTQQVNQTVKKTLAHGDLSHAHILYDPHREELTGIIDFGDAQLTDPAYDFSGLYWEYGKQFVLEVLQHYAPDCSFVRDQLFSRVDQFFGKRPIFHEILHGIKQQNHKLLQQSLYALRESLKQEKDPL